MNTIRPAATAYQTFSNTGPARFLGVHLTKPDDYTHTPRRQMKKSCPFRQLTGESAAETRVL
jgi:hypothetical protein